METAFNPSMPMMAHPYGPAGQASAANRTLYVGNLDKDIDRQKLFDTFAALCKQDSIERVDLKKDFTGESRGFAFITFTNPNDAAFAKTKFNHSKIKENQITVSFMRRVHDLDPKANLFFKNLPPQLTPKELEDKCSQFGNVICCKLKCDAVGHNLGYGYVQFEKEQAANECREALNGKLLHEKAIGVEKFVPSKSRGSLNQKCNVYVKEFPAKFNQKQVEDFIDKEFGAFGKITSKAVAKDQKVGKHYAFVAFGTPEEAKAAIDALNNYEFKDEPVKLFVDFAQSKEQRRKILREKHQQSKNETNLFIKSLNQDVTEDRLKKIFEKYGPVTSVCVRSHELAKSNPTGDKKVLKFGFINFQQSSHAADAMNKGKTDPEIKTLIDSSHYSNVDFLHFAQPKSVRTQYLRMTMKNKKSASILQKQFKMIQDWMSSMGMQRGGNFNKGYGNKRQADGQHRKPMPEGMNQGVNPMMFMHGMNPQVAAQMMPNQMFAANQNMMMAMMQAQAAQAAHAQNHMGIHMPGVMPTQPHMMMPQIHHPAAAAVQVKDSKWLKQNLKEFEILPSEEKKNILGNMMYNRVNELNPPTDLIPKITGMLIDLEVLSIEEIIEILENKTLLAERMNEAIKIIEEDAEGN
jgi:polyadenylate-binding protein